MKHIVFGKHAAVHKKFAKEIKSTQSYMDVM